MFGNCAGVELIDNPEVDGESWHEFTVVDRVEHEDYKAVVRRQLRWHERLRELIAVTDPDEFPDFRLSMVIEP